MFGVGQKKNANVTIVTTKEQLKAAIKRKDACIEVRGDLAKKMSWMAELSPKKIALMISILTGAVIAAPATVPIGTAIASSYAVAPVLVSAGVATANDVAIVAILGGTCIVGMLKGYSLKVDGVNKILMLAK